MFKSGNPIGCLKLYKQKKCFTRNQKSKGNKIIVSLKTKKAQPITESRNYFPLPSWLPHMTVVLLCLCIASIHPLLGFASGLTDYGALRPLLCACCYALGCVTICYRVPCCTAVSLGHEYKSWHFSLESNYFTTIFLVEAIATDI